MEQPPDTVIEATAEEESAIRAAVRGVRELTGGQRVATMDDAEALLDLLSDPAVNEPLYTVPNDVTLAWVQNWIAQHQAEQQAGEGVLFVTIDEDGLCTGFSDIQVWPARSAAEVGGGLRANQQSRSRGGSGAGQLFTWLFMDIGVKLLAMTCAEDNIRTQRLLERLGFTQGRPRLCTGPDGSTRPSLYWELTVEDAIKMQAQAG